MPSSEFITAPRRYIRRRKLFHWRQRCVLVLVLMTLFDWCASCPMTVLNVAFIRDLFTVFSMFSLSSSSVISFVFIGGGESKHVSLLQCAIAGQFIIALR